MGWWGPWFQLGALMDVGGAANCAPCAPWGDHDLITLGAAASLRFLDREWWGGAVRLSYRNFAGATNLIDAVGGGLALWRQAGGPPVYRDGYRFNLVLDLIFETWLDAGRATPVVGLAFGVVGAAPFQERKESE